MKMNIYSALTILGIVLFAASIPAVFLSICVADYLDSPTAILIFCVASSMLFSSIWMIEHAASKKEPIITRILGEL